MNAPTPYPEVNEILQELLTSVQAVLGEHFIGMYLDGSLASGGFDQDSDVDFVVVTDVDISGDFFPALQAMHDRIARLDSWCAIQLEGSYIPLSALRRHDPAQVLYPNIERGEGERLKMAQHDEAWIIHRYILREHGIPLVGPGLQTLIDPVMPDDLRQAVLAILHRWSAPMLSNPEALQQRGYQSYVVLSLCRILYTLQRRAVVSKLVAARWTQQAYTSWAPLIERAWAGRQNSNLKASLEDVNGTLDFIRYTLEYGRQFGNPSEPI